MHQSRTLNPAKDRPDLFQFHPFTSLKATIIKSQGGKWTYFTLTCLYFLLSSPFFMGKLLLPDSAACFKWCLIKEHHSSWLISSPDTCILAIMFGNREIRESRDICCQAATLERRTSSLLKWFQWCIKPFRNLPNAITAGDYVPLLHTRINSN